MFECRSRKYADRTFVKARDNIDKVFTLRDFETFEILNGKFPGKKGFLIVDEKPNEKISATGYMISQLEEITNVEKADINKNGIKIVICSGNTAKGEMCYWIEIAPSNDDLPF